MVTLNSSKTSNSKIYFGRKSSDFTSLLPKKLSRHISFRTQTDREGLVLIPEDEHVTGCAWYNYEKASKNGELYEEARKAGSQVLKAAKENRLKDAEIIPAKAVSKQEITAFIEGMILENYEFIKYKSKPESTPFKSLSVTSDLISPADLTELTHTLEGVFLARDLVNEPVITLNAEELSKRMKEAGSEAGFSVTVLTKKEIEKYKMGGLLGVNLGSIDDPTFNIMEYKSPEAKNKKPIVLVGKGIVYDTGGNNIKTAGHMSHMKSDMGGAAAVTGIIYAAAKNKLPIHLVALVPATDNRIDKNALVPDDIITISDGTTVEIQNTDAEGRLVLADALVYARTYNPELVLDFATLTGAAAAVTGSFGLGMMGTADAETKNKVKSCGDNVYERCAEFPFWKEYSELLKSEIADIKNIGGPIGGGTTAGKFLEHFVRYPWIHFDIAGPAFVKKAEPYKPVGGTGVGVRLIYEYLKQL